MIYYLDTSVLVAALTREARTEDIQIWLSRQNPEALAISAWVVTEFSAAYRSNCARGKSAGSIGLRPWPLLLSSARRA